MFRARSPHILIVRRHDSGSASLRSCIQRSAYHSTIVDSDDELRATFDRARVDFVVIDTANVTQDILALCATTQQRWRIPVFVVAATASTEDCIAALDAGADGYIGRPFNPRELIVRIESILRRVAQAGRPAVEVWGYRFGDWCLHVASRRLTHKDGGSVRLSGMDFSFLHVLLANPGRLLSRVHLAEMLRWYRGAAPDPSSRSTDMCICRLRKALRDERTKVLIKTVRGQGYIIGTPVQELRTVDDLLEIEVARRAHEKNTGGLAAASRGARPTEDRPGPQQSPV